VPKQVTQFAIQIRMILAVSIYNIFYLQYMFLYTRLFPYEAVCLGTIISTASMLAMSSTVVQGVPAGHPGRVSNSSCGHFVESR
jgi:hypothetical protein